MKKLLYAGLILASTFVLSSCDGPAEITVTNRPTPPVYVRPVSPGGDYVWIDGEWVARGGHYHWREGHWSRTSRVWVAGGWESRGNGWYWRRGHWQ